jgi:hypothetical protein
LTEHGTRQLSTTRTQHLAGWLFASICLLTIIIYVPGLSGDYMFDDMPNLLHNEQLNIASLDTESLQGAVFSSGSGTLRRPVSMLSFTLNRYFFGIAPYSHKVVNLLIHLLTGIGLYLLGRLVIRSYRQFRNPGLPAAALTWIPVIVAGLWLVHPLNLTPALYIVQRMTSLAALFTVLGLCFYMAGRLRLSEGKKNGLPLILTGLLLFGGLAIFSKESGALLPLYMLVLELTIFGFRNNKGKPDLPVIGFFIITVALPAGLVLLYLAFNPGYITGGYGYRNFNLEERVLTEGRVLVFYLKSILIPSIAELGLYHDDFVISRGWFDPPATFYSLMALGGMLLGALLMLGRQPLVSLGILWFFTGHLMESTIIGLELVHEHRNYLADYGIILAVTALIAQAPLRKLGAVIRIAGPAIFLLLFSYTTWVRASQWSDVTSQAIYEARHHPQSYRAVFAAGRIYAKLVLNGATEFEDEARELLIRSSELNKGEIMPHTALILLNYKLNQPVDPAWYDELFYRLSSHPVIPTTLVSLRAFIKCSEENCGVPVESVETMFNLTLNNETTSLSKKRLAEAETIYGSFTLNTRGDLQKGHRLFTQAVVHSPRDTQYRKNLINLLIVMGDLNEAEHQLALFRTANTYGGNEAIYKMLQGSIDEARKQQTTSASLGPQPGN